VAAPAAETGPPPVPTAAPPPGDTRTRTTLGGHFGGAGRTGTSGSFYRGFGRFMDQNLRIWEVGYGSRPIYPMSPAYKYSAAYGLVATPSGWTFELGALGREQGMHLALQRHYEYLAWALRTEYLRNDSLCARSDSALIYMVSEGRIRIPVTSRVTVAGLASYRGKLSRARCNFHPSLLTLGLGADLRPTEAWTFSAGLGRYGLSDFGMAQSPGFAGLEGAAEFLQLGARYTVGRFSLLTDFRYMTYGGGTAELTFGLELRSSKDAP
jgi:hypothetical protein